MTWQYTAQSPDQLAQIGYGLFNAKKQNVLDEQVQMTRLLESLAQTNILDYPVSIAHTGLNSVPDFQITSGIRRIAVELTKIAVPDVEHARALHQKGVKKVLAISSLYRKLEKPRRKDEVIAEGYTTPSVAYPVSLAEHNQIWIKAAESTLSAKSAVIARRDFQRGDENWLLLWDRIGTADWELEARQKAFATLLTPYWKQGWFSRVFLQDHHFFWQAMFTTSDSLELPSHQRI